jgi:NADH-quinone oxidoreductase subunit J
MSFYFFIFSFLIIISSLCIVISKNSITSVLYLICVFILSALCFLLIGAEFLSILIVIIYIGAISILFLFVIMMLNLRIVEVYNTLVSYFPIGSFLGLFFFLEFSFIVKNDLNFFSLNYLNNDLLELGIISYNLVWSYSNLYLLGDLLYNSYNYFLIFAGLILLLAMIGSIVLTIDTNYHNVKYKKVNAYNNLKEVKGRISF